MTFDQTEYEYEDFSECRPEEGKISRIKFRHCDFRAADFTDFATESCVFQECNFTAARLGASVHQGSAFLNCRFSLARLFSAEFHHCKMTGSDFGGADCLGLLIDGGDWSLTSLQEIDFGRMSLTDVNFRGKALTPFPSPSLAQKSIWSRPSISPSATEPSTHRKRGPCFRQLKE